MFEWFGQFVLGLESSGLTYRKLVHNKVIRARSVSFIILLTLAKTDLTHLSDHSRCLSFWYHYLGDGGARLNVSTFSNAGSRQLGSLAEQTDNLWVQRNFTIGPDENSVWVCTFKF